MENINNILEEMQLDTVLSTKDIPLIDLYMDQVIQLFENKFAETKRTPEEKILTKTMINNYSKGKLFFPIKNKKYTREHIMLINMIYEMKTVLSIYDIKQAVDRLNREISEHDFGVENLYEKYITLSEENAEEFKHTSIEMSKNVKEVAEQFSEKEKAYFEKLLLILSFVTMSNYYRRAAEKVVDEIENSNNKKSESE